MIHDIQLREKYFDRIVGLVACWYTNIIFTQVSAKIFSHSERVLATVFRPTFVVDCADGAAVACDGCVDGG